MQALLDEHDPASGDLGISWRRGSTPVWRRVRFPRGSGGLELPQKLRRRSKPIWPRRAPPGRRTARTASGWAWRRRPSPPRAPRAAAKLLAAIVHGEHFYCQLFSEPDGSDLAGVATRAVRDGSGNGDWIVNRPKVWTSSARKTAAGDPGGTDRPNGSRASRPDLFRVRHDRPGVEVRPLRQITGEAQFNEVFLTDVRVPNANRLGAEGGGWKVATTSGSTTSALPLVRWLASAARPG